MTVYTLDLRATQTETQNLAQAMLALSGAPGVQVSRLTGPVLSTAAAGLSDTTEGAAMLPTHSFNAGSQMKMVTAVVVLQLVAEGTLDLQKTATAYLGAAELKGIANAETATLEQLLAMRSGIPDYLEVMDTNGDPKFWTDVVRDPSRVHGTAEALALVRGLPPTGAAGEKFHYSNTNYELLGRIAEAATGQSLEALCRARVFKPAGMTQTTTQGWPLTADRSHGYVVTGDGSLLDATPLPVDIGGDGGLITTTADLVRLLDALFTRKILVSAADLARMTQPISTVSNFDGGSLTFGLGMSSIRTATDVFHGFSGGEATNLSATHWSAATGSIVSTMENRDRVPEGKAGTYGLNLQELARVAASGTDSGLTLIGATDTLTLVGSSAADLSVTSADGQTLLTAGASRIQIASPRDALRPDQISFADGSRLLMGTAGAETLIGGAGNDRFIGSGGADRLDGGSGRDHLSLSGARADYQLTQDGNGGWRLSHTTGTSQFTGIEVLDFADQSYTLPSAAVSGPLVHRFYNKTVGTHFWTASDAEVAALKTKGGGFAYEGPVFQAAGSDATVEVFRLFHTKAGRHFYTASAEERAALLANSKSGYRDEGIAFKAYAADAGPQEAVHRLFHTKTGTHFYTDSVAEKDALLLGQKDFKYEGIAFWVLP